MLEAHGFGGAAVSPHILSTTAALEILGQGGSAVDAAIALNAVQGVVAPETCGIGGDLFALIHSDGRVTALNSSGPAGSGASAAALRDEGHTSIPRDHPATVTIPGCVAGWFALHDRHGRLPMRALLERAIELAHEGFPASTEYAAASLRLAPFLAEHAPGAQVLQAGAPPLRGARVVRPNLGRTLQAILDEGPGAVYRGGVAASISEAVSGLITADDLAAFTPEWVAPISAELFGITGWTIPPNSQGYVTLAALQLFEAFCPTDDPGDPLWAHTLIEAYRAVAVERDDVVADPAHAPVPPQDLVDPERVMALAGGVDLGVVTPRARPSVKPGGTMYACVVDDEGMGVSLIESNYRGLGSGRGAGEAGFVLHDRGGGFDLRPGHPNEIGPGKRPLHTLSPTLWTDGDRLRGVLGTRGGHQQPQLLMQVAALVFGADWSSGTAQAAPRWTIADLTTVGDGSRVDVEHGTDDAVVHGLLSLGHHVTTGSVRPGNVGPASLIHVAEDGLRTAAADPRVDTAAAGVR